MTSKPSQDGEAPSASDDNKDIMVIDGANPRQSFSLEILEDGKLVLNYTASEHEVVHTHTGKWTDEEMAYAEGLIDEFKEGNIALPDGTSLRQFLAKMLNCSPKRISKRFEGNNYSKGRKFYLKSATKLDVIEAKKRWEKLQELERRYKQKQMQMKIPHMPLANRSQDDVQEQGETTGRQDKKLTSINSKKPGVSGDTVSGNATLYGPCAAKRSTGASGLVGGVGAKSSLSLDNHASSNHADLHETLGPSIPLPSDSNGMVAPSASEIAALMNSLKDRPRLNTGLLTMQLQRQQAESQRLFRLLELQREVASTTCNIGQHQLGSSLLHSDLQPPSVFGDPLTSLVNNSHRARDNSASISYQLQDLLRAEEARVAVSQNVARSHAASLTVAELIRPSSFSTPFLSSLAPSRITAQFQGATTPQVESLIRMQRHAQQAAAASSTHHLNPSLLLGMVPRHAFTMSNEDEALDQPGCQDSSTSISRQMSCHDQAIHLLNNTTSFLPTRSLSQSENSASRSAQTPSDPNALFQLPSSCFLAASDLEAFARGQKRYNNDQASGDNVARGSPRRRLDDL